MFSLTSILNLLDAHPEIIELNKSCGLKFKKRFISQSEPMLKKVNKVKTALIIGSGSIGQRHIRNLKRIGINDIIALRSKKGHYKKLPKDLQVIEVDSWDDAIREKARHCNHIKPNKSPSRGSIDYLQSCKRCIY